MIRVGKFSFTKIYFWQPQWYEYNIFLSLAQIHLTLDFPKKKSLPFLLWIEDTWMLEISTYKMLLYSLLLTALQQFTIAYCLLLHFYICVVTIFNRIHSPVSPTRGWVPFVSRVSLKVPPQWDFSLPVALDVLTRALNLHPEFCNQVCTKRKKKRINLSIKLNCTGVILILDGTNMIICCKYKY